MLAAYEKPKMDEGIAEGLRDFIAKRERTSMLTGAAARAFPPHSRQHCCAIQSLIMDRRSFLIAAVLAAAAAATPRTDAASQEETQPPIQVLKLLNSVPRNAAAPSSSTPENAPSFM